MLKKYLGKKPLSNMTKNWITLRWITRGYLIFLQRSKSVLEDVDPDY
jgi:hypothetical protein